MPDAPKTKHRMVRVPDEDWDELGVVTNAAGSDRAKAINAFIRWYLRRPGAKLPKQSAHAPTSAD